LRAANTHYSPDKKVLLFGYFPTSSEDRRSHFLGGIVFTCLAQDIVAHETSHALRDGLNRCFIGAAPGRCLGAGAKPFRWAANARLALLLPE
jgi:hypothetical protein